MKFLQFVLQLMIAFTFVQLVRSGDKIIEDVEKEEPETLDGIQLIEVKGAEKKFLTI